MGGWACQLPHPLCSFRLRRDNAFPRNQRTSSFHLRCRPGSPIALPPSHARTARRSSAFRITALFSVTAPAEDADVTCGEPTDITVALSQTARDEVPALRVSAYWLPAGANASTPMQLIEVVRVTRCYWAKRGRGVG